MSASPMDVAHLEVALAGHDFPTALELIRHCESETPDLTALIDRWIVRGDCPCLTDFSQVLGEQEILTAERVRLNGVWGALASGDLHYALSLLPEQVSELGEKEWGYAAEAALLYALLHYGCGDLARARTFAGLAQSGLTGQRRHSLLLIALLVQSRVALHESNSDLAESCSQLASSLPWQSPGARSWQKAIESIAHLASGRYDDALKCADSAILQACTDAVGLHLFPHCALVVKASINRDRCNQSETKHTLAQATIRLRQTSQLPLQTEITALTAHVQMDGGSTEAEGIALLLALGTHPLAVPELQDLIDAREVDLRVRINDLTRARVLIDRMESKQIRTFLQAGVDAESHPSRTLVQAAGGGFRWHRQQVEAEMIRARSRVREQHSSSVHLWRALELASQSGTVRPLLDNPMSARLFSTPNLRELLDSLEGDDDTSVGHHLERVLQEHQKHALSGPESHALTARELEVLRAVADGADFSAVAKLLVLSRWTVKGHFYRACKKLGISGRDAAIAKVHQIDQPRHVSQCQGDDALP
jgi:DNA-binding CsgD family transcriptional regulator